MKIIITGATGFIGRYLVPALLKNNHQIIVMGRNPLKIHKIFGESMPAVSWDQLNTLIPDDFDAVINLAGENLAQLRWTDGIKKEIIHSRIKATTEIVNWSLKSHNKKPHIYNTSAIGVYGLQSPNSAALTEDSTLSSHTSDFLSEVGITWERACQAAIKANHPVTIMRFGIVLKRGEGFLKKLELPFQCGLGTILGTGEQMMSWIHINDLVRAIIFLLEHPNIIGCINLCSPNAVSQKTFAKTFAATLNRPLILTMPAPIIKLIFGQMGEELLLGGQHVLPQKLTQLGFKFDAPTIEKALTSSLK